MLEVKLRSELVLEMTIKVLESHQLCSGALKSYKGYWKWHQVCVITEIKNYCKLWLK